MTRTSNLVGQFVLALFVCWSGVLVASILAGALTARRPATVHLRAGDTAPDFVLPALHRPGEFNSLGEYRGSTVVLVFWSSRSLESQGSLLLLDRLQREITPVDVRVVAIALEAPQDVTSAALVGQLMAPTIDHLHDAAGTAYRAYRITSVPSWFLIDGAGVIRGNGTIPIVDADTVRSVIEAVG
jgi:peroxiredoxin